jgi:hypothetical protein
MNEEEGPQKLFPCQAGCDKTKALQKKTPILLLIIDSLKIVLTGNHPHLNPPPSRGRKLIWRPLLWWVRKGG